MVAEDGVTVDPKMWTEGHAKVVKRAAFLAGRLELDGERGEEGK